MSNVFKLRPTHFSKEGKKRARGASPACAPGYGHALKEWPGNNRVNFIFGTFPHVLSKYWGDLIRRWLESLASEQC